MLGLLLSVVLEELNGREVRVVETAPPREPRHYRPIWGEKRVVRARELEGGSLELVVARELLREEKIESERAKG